MSVTSVEKDPEALTMTVTADLDATVERVWQLWSDPRQFEQWWGPPGYPVTVVDHDLRAGGRITFFMAGAEGERHDSTWEVMAADPPRQLELRDADVDDDGRPNDGNAMTAMIITLDERPGGGTVMAIRTHFDSLAAWSRCSRWGSRRAMCMVLSQIDAVLAGSACVTGRVRWSRRSRCRRRLRSRPAPARSRARTPRLGRDRGGVRGPERRSTSQPANGARPQEGQVAEGLDELLDLVPVVAGGVAEADEDGVPDAAADGGERHEPGDGHALDAGRDRHDAADQRDEPPQQHDLVAVPGEEHLTAGEVAGREEEEPPLGGQVLEALPPEQLPDEVEHQRAHHRADGGRHPGGDEVEVALGRREAGEGEDDLRRDRRDDVLEGDQRADPEGPEPLDDVDHPPGEAGQLVGVGGRERSHEGLDAPVSRPERRCRRRGPEMSSGPPMPALGRLEYAMEAIRTTRAMPATM